MLLPDIGSAFCSLEGKHTILPLNYRLRETLSFTVSCFPPPGPPYSAREPRLLAQQPELTSQAPSTALSQPTVKHELSYIPADSALLCILFNKPPATLDLRNKEMARDLFTPGDRLETWTQISMIISKIHFVFCKVWSPFHFVFAQVIHWIHMDIPNE